jgi:predicted AlkP superfamily pyrophosphatase or phosphodiesterase
MICRFFFSIRSYPLFLLILYIFPNAFGSETIDKQPDNENYVVIISIDGFPSEALWDEQIPLNAIRSLAENGVWSQKFVPSTPTVTWPNHTTLVTGVYPEKHGVLTNGRYVDTRFGILRDSNVDRDVLTSYPSIYDVAYKAGLVTAAVNWPVTRNAKTLRFSMPDAPNGIEYTTPQLLQELVEAKILSDKTDATFRATGIIARDDAWTSAAEHVIIRHRPNLLLFHLLNVDSTHHRYGKDTDAGFSALALADTHIQRILDALDYAGIKERTSIFLVSDHGFMNISHRVHPNVLLHKHGLIDLDENGFFSDAKVHAISNGGTAMVFSRNRNSMEHDLELVYRIFSDAEGISHVIRPEQYREYGLPLPSENKNMGHLLLNAADNFSFGNDLSGVNYIEKLNHTEGAHGYLNTLTEMETIFIASGYGIRKMGELGRIDIRSLAPTAAAILGLNMPHADGPVLQEIFK